MTSEAKVVESEEAHQTPKNLKLNNYTFACAILASITSILLGYGQSYPLLFQHNIILIIAQTYTLSSYRYRCHEWSSHIH